MNKIDILEEKEKEAIKDLEEYLHWEELQGFSMLPRDKHIETLLNLVETLIAENKEKDEEIENQDKTIDRLVKEQEEREKYTHQLEAENKELAEETKNGFRKILKKGFELKTDTYTIQQNFYDYYKNMK